MERVGDMRVRSHLDAEEVRDGPTELCELEEIVAPTPPHVVATHMRCHPQTVITNGEVHVHCAWIVTAPRHLIPGEVPDLKYSLPSVTILEKLAEKTIHLWSNTRTVCTVEATRFRIHEP